ncbi:MAG TPA: FAD-binding oxidoreductase [Acidimicrobiia bacterium]
MLDERLRRGLVGVVGAAHVLDDPDVTASYEVDWTGRFRGKAAAVVRPGSTEEVAGVLSLLHEAGRPVVLQGGNTGLVGGGIPHHGELVLSLTRLRDVGPVDPLTAQVTVGAGTSLAGVHEVAAGAGLAFGVDLAARDSATAGGMVATNAGGLRVLRYGDMRANVVGIEVVLAGGAVLSHLSGLTKDNTGYHLPGLFAGSEGTLGVVTRARLRLVPRLDARATGLVAFAGVEPAMEALAELRRRLSGCLEAAEMFFACGVTLVCDHLGIPPPFATLHPVYLLVEVAAATDPTEELATAVLEGVGDRALDGAVESDPAGRARLWRYREAHTEAVNAAGVHAPGQDAAGGSPRASWPIKLDVSLPGPALAEFVPRVQEAVAGVAPQARCVLFGHAGDGNLHVNVLGALLADGHRVEDCVLQLVAGFGGSISAEHGIGVAKRAWLHLNRSPAEIAAFRAVKFALDPKGILNPDVLLP